MKTPHILCNIIKNYEMKMMITILGTGCMEVNCCWHFLQNVSRTAQLHIEPTLKSSYQHITLLITIRALHKTLNMYWQLDKAPACGLVLQLKKATNPPNIQKDSLWI